MAWQNIREIQRLRATESGAVVRDWGGKLPIVLGYANSYAVGMSSLAIHSLYRWFNELPDVICERTFAWYSKASREAPGLLTMETQRSVRDTAVLAISLSFEMDYLNLVTMLRHAGIRERADERQDGDPIVLLGGPAVAANPEPLAEIADAVVIGEIEPIIARLTAALQASWHEERRVVLQTLSALPGVYVPALHLGQAIQHLVQPDLDEYTTATSIICPKSEFGDMHLVEISRGCGHACRFCLAGCWYLPLRERSLDLVAKEAIKAAQGGLRLGLVGAAVSDYSRLDELLDRISALNLKLSVSSLRADRLSARLLTVLAASGERAITIAPEAGSERLRQVIHKGVTEDDILRAARLTAGYPFDTLKLYYMIGLPTEREEDLRALIALSERVHQESGHQVVVNITPFIPKAHTPWQRQGMAQADELTHNLSMLKRSLTQLRISVRAESVREATVQALLARGDRSLGRVLMALTQPTSANFLQALAKAGVDIPGLLGKRPRDAVLPWSFIKMSRH